jgi:hypothetical protein
MGEWGKDSSPTPSLPACSLSVLRSVSPDMHRPLILANVAVSLPSRDMVGV